MRTLNTFEAMSRSVCHSVQVTDFKINTSKLFQLPSINMLSHDSEVRQAHRFLKLFNQTRLEPKTPEVDLWDQLSKESDYLKLETQLLQWELHQIMPLLADLPKDPDLFMAWFEQLKETGPGQNHPLFDWLANKANAHQMKWFIKQEIAGEAGFDDLTALTQLKLPLRAKLEVARNYWDEMGRGKRSGVHGLMLSDLAQEMNLGEADIDEIVPESFALGNILLGFAANRRYAYHSIGALGAVELTAPGRAKKVYEGLKRLNYSAQGQRYYLLHSSLDIKHSAEWNKEVIYPIVKDNTKLIPFIAQGALARLNAGQRCFRRYQLEFGAID